MTLRELLRLLSPQLTISNMKKSGGTSTPLWHQALDKYRDELQGGAEDFNTIQGVRSLQDLIDSLSSIQINAPGAHSGLASLNRLAPRLKFVDDFAAVLALCFGADAALTAAVWGSIRLILTHASSASETFQDILDMLEELSLTLPRFQVYEQTLPLNHRLQQSLVDVYSEIICFYARTIHFLRSNPHLVLRKNAWRDFRNDFSHTIMRIKRMSSTLESEADMWRMQSDQGRYKEVLELLNTMKLANKTEDTQKIKYNNIPFPVNTKFSGRKDILDTIDRSLNYGDTTTTTTVKSMALFGMGGVGKTQIALHYAYQNLDKFDVVLWIAADNAIAISQSLRAVAEGLGLLRTEDDIKDAAGAVWKVKNWLATTRTATLLVFDNADDLTSLKMAWPGTMTGSVLLTTRDLEVATTLTAQYIQVDALTDEAGAQMLIKAVGAGKASETTADQAEYASNISRNLGGLPLALAQIAGFVVQRKLSLREVLPLYERYSSKIDSRKAPGSDYQHTLSTVWNVSFDKLGQAPAQLLHILSFLDPDGVSEDILLEGSHGLDEELSFLSDEFDLGDAAEELMRGALINRSGDPAVLTVHRLVQSAARKRLGEEERPKYFDAVVRMLCWGFPDHSSVDIGHQIASWTRCEKCLPHVNHLVDISTGYEKKNNKSGDQQKYADLLVRCGWYLYEREMYSIARKMVDRAISTFQDTNTLAYASAIDLGGLIDLDLTQASRALTPFKRALEIRRSHLGPQDPFIAYSLNNIALAYTEMDDLGQAYQAHQEAIRLRLEANSDRTENSYCNMSSLLLRMGRPDDAEEMLARCPSLPDFNEETFLATKNPRWSGSMVLLSRIRLAQGRLGEALRTASKALAFRRQLLGNGLKTCDSQYDVACMLHQDGHTSSAIQLLEEIVSITETLAEGEGQQARALYKLSVIQAERGMEAESTALKARAIALLAKLKPELKGEPLTDAVFSKLCLWMLW